MVAEAVDLPLRDEGSVAPAPAPVPAPRGVELDDDSEVGGVNGLFVMAGGIGKREDEDTGERERRRRC